MTMLKIRRAKQQDYTCAYCRRKFRPKALTFEHIFPKSVFGATRYKRPLVCKSCNMFKAADSPVEFLRRLETVKRNFMNSVFAVL